MQRKGTIHQGCTPICQEAHRQSKWFRGCKGKDRQRYEGQFHHTYAGDASVKKDVSDAMSKLDEASDTIKRGLRVRSSSSLSLPSSQEGGKRTRRHRRQRKSNKRRSKHVASTSPESRSAPTVAVDKYLI